MAKSGATFAACRKVNHSGVLDAHQFHGSSRREPAQTPPAGIMSLLTPAAPAFRKVVRLLVPVD
jgi:hypothetical protein